MNTLLKNLSRAQRKAFGAAALVILLPTASMAANPAPIQSDDPECTQTMIDQGQCSHLQDSVSINVTTSSTVQNNGSFFGQKFTDAPQDVLNGRVGATQFSSKTGSVTVTIGTPVQAGGEERSYVKSISGEMQPLRPMDEMGGMGASNEAAPK